MHRIQRDKKRRNRKPGWDSGKDFHEKSGSQHREDGEAQRQETAWCGWESRGSSVSVDQGGLGQGWSQDEVKKQRDPRLFCSKNLLGVFEGFEPWSYFHLISILPAVWWRVDLRGEKLWPNNELLKLCRCKRMQVWKRDEKEEEFKECSGGKLGRARDNETVGERETQYLQRC